MRRAAVIAPLILSLSAGLARSAGVEQSPQRPAAVPTGLIAGKVVEAGSGQAVTESVVTLDGAPAGRRRVMVDAQGRYVFTSLPPGTYRVQVEQFGYVRSAYGKVHPLGVGGGRPIDLAEGQRVTDATILMWRMASISGRVVDEAGEPVAGVSVRPLLRTIRNGQVSLEAAFAGYQSQRTDDRGRYRAALLPPGDYAVAVPVRLSTFPAEAWKDGLPAGRLGISEVSLLGDSRNLQVGDHILTSISSAPIPPAALPGRPLIVYVTSYHAGTASEAEAQVMSLGPGENRAGVDIQLVTAPTTTVSGQVTGPDGAVQWTPFRLVRADGAATSDQQDFEVATGLTNAEGRFTLMGVPRGQYILRLVVTTRPPGAQPAPTLWANEVVTIGDSAVTNLAVTARRSPVIAGRVEIQSKKKVALTDMTVVLQAYDAGPTRLQNPRLTADLRFEATVAPGRYFITAFAPAGLFCTTTTAGTSGGVDLSDGLIDLADQNLENVLIACGETATEVNGGVRTERGEPDHDALVVAFSTDRLHWSGPGYRPRRVTSVRVSASGTFAIRNLPPGEYFVAAVSATLRHWDDVRELETLSRSAVRVKLGAAESTTIALRRMIAK